MFAVLYPSRWPWLKTLKRRTPTVSTTERPSGKNFTSLISNIQPWSANLKWQKGIKVEVINKCLYTSGQILGLIHHFLFERGSCFGDNTFLLTHISHTTPTLSAFPQRSTAAAFSECICGVGGLGRDGKLNEACFMLSVASCWWQIHLVCKENKMGKDNIRKSRNWGTNAGLGGLSPYSNV